MRHQVYNGIATYSSLNIRIQEGIENASRGSPFDITGDLYPVFTQILNYFFDYGSGCGGEGGDLVFSNHKLFSQLFTLINIFTNSLEFHQP